MANTDLSNGSHIEEYSIDVYPAILWELGFYKITHLMIYGCGYSVSCQGVCDAALTCITQTCIFP